MAVTQAPEGCKGSCLLPLGVFSVHGGSHSVLTWGVADVRACTTEGDLKDEGFNSGCHLTPMGSPWDFDYMGLRGPRALPLRVTRITLVGREGEQLRWPPPSSLYTPVGPGPVATEF